jgi:hypothetical protein
MLKNFSVPVPLHLLRFAEKEYFEGMKPPYKVTERSLLGKHIMFLLNDRRSFELDEQALSFEEYIEISLSEELAKCRPSLIKLSRLNRYLDEAFKQSLLLWVKAQTSAGLSKTQSLIMFLDHYSIPEPYEKFFVFYDYIKTNQKRIYHRLKDPGE